MFVACVFLYCCPLCLHHGFAYYPQELCKWSWSDSLRREMHVLVCSPLPSVATTDEKGDAVTKTVRRGQRSVDAQ